MKCLRSTELDNDIKYAKLFISDAENVSNPKEAYFELESAMRMLSKASAKLRDYMTQENEVKNATP
jgi:hypothetical protein